MKAKTLVLGIGNPTRGDDAVGWQAADRLADLQLPDVEVQTAQQLTVEMAEDWSHRDRVVVIDAAVGGQAIQLEQVPVGPHSAGAISSSHHFSPGMVQALALSLYGRCAQTWVLTIPGHAFGLGARPTREALDATETALEHLLQMLGSPQLRETSGGSAVS